jgi:hypothetical protein
MKKIGRVLRVMFQVWRIYAIADCIYMHITTSPESEDAIFALILLSTLVATYPIPHLITFLKQRNWGTLIPMERAKLVLRALVFLSSIALLVGTIVNTAHSNMFMDRTTSIFSNLLVAAATTLMIINYVVDTRTYFAKENAPNRTLFKTIKISVRTLWTMAIASLATLAMPIMLIGINFPGSEWFMLGIPGGLLFGTLYAALLIGEKIWEYSKILYTRLFPRTDIEKNS